MQNGKTVVSRDAVNRATGLAGLDPGATERDFHRGRYLNGAKASGFATTAPSLAKVFAFLTALTSIVAADAAAITGEAIHATTEVRDMAAATRIDQANPGTFVAFWIGYQLDNATDRETRHTTLLPRDQENPMTATTSPAPVPLAPVTTVHAPVPKDIWDQVRAWAKVHRINLTDVAAVLFAIALAASPIPTGTIPCHHCGRSVDIEPPRPSAPHRGVLAKHENTARARCDGGNTLPCLANPCDTHPHPAHRQAPRGAEVAAAAEPPHTRTTQET